MATCKASNRLCSPQWFTPKTATLMVAVRVVTKEATTASHKNVSDSGSSSMNPTVAGSQTVTYASA